MKFSDLDFCHIGCCGTSTWATVRHANGLRSEVYQEEDGHRVVTFCGATVQVGAQKFSAEADVLARLAADAALSL
jgi:hypothetical protein